MTITLNWPTSGLDTLPKPGAGTYTDDAGYELDEVVTAFATLLEDMQEALGYAPSSGDAVGMLRLLTSAGNKGIALPIATLGAAAGIFDNGNFDVWQQGTSGGAHTTTYDTLTSYLPDQMFCLPAGAAVSSARSTTVPDAKSRYSWAITGATSATTVDAGQRVRSAYQARYATSLVYSAWVKNESGADFTPTLVVRTPSAVDNFTTRTARLTQALQVCTNSAWTRVHHVFDPSAYTDIGNGLEATLQLPSGALSSGSKIVRLAQMDLRPGTQLLDYVPPDPDAELNRAGLYYERFGGLNVFEALGSGLAFATTQANILIGYRPKWASPILSVSSAANFAVTNGSGTGIACTAISPAGAGLSRAFLTCTVASGLTAKEPSYMQANNTASASLHVNARL